MMRLFEADPEQIFLLLGLAAVAVFAILGAHVAKKIRSGSAQQEQTATDLLSKFREMHSRGVLSDAEFRTIKTALGTQLRDQLKDKDEKG